MAELEELKARVKKLSKELADKDHSLELAGRLGTELLQNNQELTKKLAQVDSESVVKIEVWSILFC